MQANLLLPEFGVAFYYVGVSNLATEPKNQKVQQIIKRVCSWVDAQNVKLQTATKDLTVASLVSSASSSQTWEDEHGATFASGKTKVVLTERTDLDHCGAKKFDARTSFTLQLWKIIGTAIAYNDSNIAQPFYGLGSVEVH